MAEDEVLAYDITNLLEDASRLLNRQQVITYILMQVEVGGHTFLVE